MMLDVHKKRERYPKIWSNCSGRTASRLYLLSMIDSRAEIDGNALQISGQRPDRQRRLSSYNMDNPPQPRTSEIVQKSMMSDRCYRQINYNQVNPVKIYAWK